MAKNLLAEFLVGIGFDIDTTGQAKADAAVKNTEAKLTATTREALAQRQKAQDKALADRINAVVSVGAELDAEEKAAAARFLKTHQETADKHAKAETEAAKKSREKREATIKEIEKFAVRFASIATALITSVEAAAVGVVAVADKAAKSFENLHYASARMGSSVQNMTAFAYGISQLGGSADDADESLKRFGHNLRVNAPGYEGLLKHLGVRTRDAAGNLRDTAELATDALQALRGKPYAVGLNTAETLGFSENTYQSGIDPRLPGLEAQRKAEQDKMGFNPDKAGTEATAFEQSMRHLIAVAKDVASKVDENLFKKIQPLLDALAKWLVDNGGKIADVVSTIADKLISVADTITKSLGGVNYDDLFGKAGDEGNKLIPSLSRVETAVGNIAKGVQYLLGKLGELAQFKVLGNLGGLGTSFGQFMGWLPPSAGAGGGFDNTTATIGPRLRGQRDAPFNPNATGNGKWKDAGATKGEVADYIRTAAAKNGIDPDVALRVAKSEGFNTYTGDFGTSFGPFQLHYGGSGIPGMNSRGMGDDFTRDTRLDARDPKTWKAQIDYSMRRAAREGWSAWHGARATGIGDTQGIGTYRGLPPAPMYNKPAAAPATPPAPASAAPADSIPRPGRFRWGVPAGKQAWGDPMFDPRSVITTPPPLGLTPSTMSSIDNSRGDVTITHSPVFHVSGGNVTANMEAARLSASRGLPDKLRDLQGSVS